MSDPIDLVVEACQAVAAAGLSDMVWGHASVRDPDGCGVWMNAAGWAFEEIDRQRVVLISSDGEVLAGEEPAHLEFPIHTEILDRRTELGSVVHFHAPAVTAFASLECDLQPISHDAVVFCDPQLPRYTATGSLVVTRELGSALADDLGDANGALMPNHGAVTVGPDPQTAVFYAVLLERACRTQLLAMAAGGPHTCSDEQETVFKREQVWGPVSRVAGWKYLVRKADAETAA